MTYEELLKALPHLMEEMEFTSKEVIFNKVHYTIETLESIGKQNWEGILRHLQYCKEDGRIACNIQNDNARITLYCLPNGWALWRGREGKHIVGINVAIYLKRGLCE